MIDPLYRFLPWDHVSLGQRLRQAREATMGLLLVAPPEPAPLPDGDFDTELTLQRQAADIRSAATQPCASQLRRASAIGSKESGTPTV